MTPGTSIQVLSLLFLTFPLLSHQTPVTHVVTKTLSAGDLGATVFPTETPNATPSGVIEITIPAIPMAPGNTVTITTIIAIDGPSGNTFIGDITSSWVLPVVMMVCLLAVEAHRQGYTWRLYKKFLDALPKAESPKGKAAAPSNQEKQEKQEKKEKQQKKPNEQPQKGESSKKSEQQAKPSDTSAERQTQHEREVNRISSLPPPPGPVPPPRPESSSSPLIPNRRKSVSFSLPDGNDGRSVGSDRSRGSRVTVNIV